MDFRDFASFYVSLDFVISGWESIVDRRGTTTGNVPPFPRGGPQKAYEPPLSNKGDFGKANPRYFDPIRREYLKGVISLDVLNSSPKAYLPNNMIAYLAHKAFLKIFDVKDAVIVE